MPEWNEFVPKWVEFVPKWVEFVPKLAEFVPTCFMVRPSAPTKKEADTQPGISFLLYNYYKVSDVVFACR